MSPSQLVSFVGKNGRKLLPDGRIMLYLAPFDDSREILIQSKELLDELALS